MTQQGRDAAESRKKVYERQERTARDRVVIAGRLGHMLWSIGKGLLAAAAGAASPWYAMTGRPLP